MLRRIRLLLAPSSKHHNSSSSSNQQHQPPLDIHAAFRVLGLPATGASPEQARQQYLKLARRFHPDMTNGDDTKMKAVNLAYEMVQAHSSSPSSSFSDVQFTKAKRPRSSAFDKDDHVDDFGSERGDDLSPEAKSSSRRGYSHQKPRPSPLGDAASWNARPEFEWKAAIFDVNESDASNPRNHAHTFNRHFSFADDASIFRAVRSGATAAEVARTMGRTPYAIEARMNSTQFKLRIQKLLKSSDAATADSKSNNRSASINSSDTRMRAKGEYSRQVHPMRDTVYRAPRMAEQQHDDNNDRLDEAFLYPEEVASSQSSSSEFSTRIASAQGRSYAHLTNYMAGRRKRF